MTGRFLATLAIACLASGCTTMRSSDTARTGKEQLLISNAVDQSLSKVEFTALNGQKVFLDQQYLDCVDKGYVVSSMRERLFHAGASVVDKAEEADVVLEVRSGGVGTDNIDSFVGLPKLSLPGPLPISFPEVRLWSREKHQGIAKLGIVAYDAKNKALWGHGGKVLSQSDDTGYTVMGIGPFRQGSIREEVALGTSVEHNFSEQVKAEYGLMPANDKAGTESAGRPQERDLH